MQKDKYYLDELDDVEGIEEEVAEPPVKYSFSGAKAFALPNKRIHKRAIIYNSSDPTTRLCDYKEQNNSSTKDYCFKKSIAQESPIQNLSRNSSIASCPEQSSSSIILDCSLLDCDTNIEEIAQLAKLTAEKRCGLVARVNKLSEFAFTELTSKGYCGVNHLLGNCYAESILEVAKKLYDCDSFVPGEHAVKGENVRFDKITWIGPDNLKSLNSPALQILLYFLDAVISNLNDKLTECELTHKSRAMLACYPANSDGYDKHCDNPHALNDGRYLTCIYYLNSCWDSEADGGDLIMWPEMLKRKEIALSPIMDRAVMFYADERTLHQVAPNKKERFALTVWYFDKIARKNYWLKQHKEYSIKS